MRYIGSKAWCAERLFETVQEELPDATSLCDPFAGTCTVPAYFKKQGFRTVTGDLLALSYAMQVALIQLNTIPSFSALRGFQGLGDKPTYSDVFGFLNCLPGRAGWLTNNFSLKGKCRRKFFTVENARKIDSIRLQISRWWKSGRINDAERWYLLACLLDACDRVANTAGTYYAYLREFYRKAKQPLLMKHLSPHSNGKSNRAYRGEAEKVVRRARVDVLYLDPPYNMRDYGAYYHLPELIASGITPEVYGLSGRPCIATSSSRFCSRGTATEALKNVINATSARLIILHYASYGLIDHKCILRMLKAKGETHHQIWRCRTYQSNRAATKKQMSDTRVYICHVG
jgi:adenine-specific DNA-methyltransferase